MNPEAATLRDPELVEGIQRGEAAAETALYERYSARVYYLALSELRSPHDAEDVRAETFLRVLQAIRQDRLQRAGALAAFILNTARNVIHETTRRARKAEAIAAEYGIEQARRRAAASTFLDADVKRAIERTVDRLKPRERAFLRMYYYDELPKQEIARRLGIKEERVRLIKSRALQHFREVYGRLTKKGDTK